MSNDKYDLLDALYDKSQTLYDALQELNDRLDPSDRPNFEGMLLNMELEIERTDQQSDLIEHDRRLPWPSDQQIEALIDATGELARIVGINAAYVRLSEAATTLIRTWPVSRAG